MNRFEWGAAVRAAACCSRSGRCPRARRSSTSSATAPWIEKHGYSTDYIKQKVGKRQFGTAENWRGNVDVKDVQPGDVVLTRLRDNDKSMRASYVEEVRRNADGSPGAVLVSEWNEGRYTDQRCS